MNWFNYEGENVMKWAVLSDLHMNFKNCTTITARDKLVDALKKENENMRITLSTLDQKAGRKETRQLQLYQIAIEKLMVSSPGFAPAWQQALSEAEESLKSSIVGKIPFVGRFITSGNSHILIEDKDSLK